MANGESGVGSTLAVQHVAQDKRPGHGSVTTRHPVKGQKTVLGTAQRYGTVTQTLALVSVAMCFFFVLCVCVCVVFSP